MNYKSNKNKKQNEKLVCKIDYIIFINFIKLLIRLGCFPKKNDEIDINDKTEEVPENKNKQRQITLCK